MGKKLEEALWELITAIHRNNEKQGKLIKALEQRPDFVKLKDMATADHLKFLEELMLEQGEMKIVPMGMPKSARNFTWAIEMAGQGHTVARRDSSWDAAVLRHAIKSHRLVLYTRVQNVPVYYYPSMDDMKAFDWYIVEEKP